jgi:hypothetical protein
MKANISTRILENMKKYCVKKKIEKIKIENP